MIETASLDLAARGRMAGAKQANFDLYAGTALAWYARAKAAGNQEEMRQAEEALDGELHWARQARLNIPAELEKRGAEPFASNPDKPTKKVPKRLRKLLPGRSFLTSADDGVDQARRDVALALPRLQVSRNEHAPIEMELYR